ncbi:MAG: ABC transporter ATP-binding protein [Oscillospiraceae bacterium]|nr:ABC transporter ATP-binding protein [Oscillospiraceae bacterium]
MKITDIKKSFDRFSLHIENLETTTGKIHGIIGPNGCGKTTIMKIMAGLIKPDSGDVDYENLSSREFTMVFRKPYLLHDTVIHNLIYPLKIRRINPDNELVEHYLEIAGLQDYRNQYALGLSGGEQQKLSLIRALIFLPKLIFMDEGFSNMDIEGVAFFEDYILNMQKTKPMTWVIISHQLSNIKRLCDYVYFMHDGKIEAHGEPAEILQDPENVNLKRYLHYM